MARLYKQKRSPFWWLDYVDLNGTRQRVSSHTTSKKRAAELLTLREAEVLKGEVVGPRADRCTFVQVRDNLLSYYRVSGRVKNLDDVADRLSYLSRVPVAGFFSGFGSSRVTAITSARVREYCEFRLGETARPGHTTSPATVNRELALLRRMLRLGASEGLVMKVPRIELLREAPPRQGFIDDAQFNSLAAHLRPDLRCIVTIAYKLGWRVKSEVLTLEKRQVDLENGSLRLEPGTTKNREGRVAYLTPDLEVMLTAQLERVSRLEKEMKRIIPYVFPHLRGRLRGRRIASFGKAWRHAARSAGLPGLLIHDLRRSAVRNMERVGVPRSVAMKVTGHRTESVYRRYAIVSDSDLKNAARLLTTQRGGGQAV